MKVKRSSLLRWSLMSLLLVLAWAGCGPLPAAPSATAFSKATSSPPPPALTPTAVDPAQVEVLTWQREGGIAGFCDSVIVFADGEVRVSSCKKQAVGSAHLSEAEADQVLAWFDRLAPFEHLQSDDAVADGMTVRLTFAGRGTQAATEADLQAMLDFAAALVRPADPSS